MVKGYAGRVLRVNLTDGEMWTEQPPDSFYRRYLGGAGFVAYYLLREMPKGADPLGPDNLLVFSGGTFTGIPIAGAGRSSIGGKSPLTGGYGEAEVGGFFGAEVKRAGFDAIVIQGKASGPVYLWLCDGKAEIRQADHLWGMSTLDCHHAILSEVQDPHVRTAIIGPGGEKLVRYSCVIADLRHAAGRTGIGALMGSKNLKAVAARGRADIAVADADKIRDLGRWMRDNWEKNGQAKRRHDLGTAGDVEGLNTIGALPTRNFHEGQFDGAERISGAAMRDTILLNRAGCYACPIRCKRVVEVDSEEYQVDPDYGGPEYETVASFGSNCGVDDLKAIAKAHELCNAYGLDTISTGMMVSFAMECFEKGLLTAEETGGLELNFGNAKAMLELTRMICDREGLGDVLAQGPRKAARWIGQDAERFLLAVKNQPFPMHECRIRHGQALGYAVSPTGADHMHNIWDGMIAREPLSESVQSMGIYESVPPTVLNSQKTRAYMYVSNWQWIYNYLEMCMFIPWTRDQIVDLVKAITGWQTNLWELLRTAERGVTMAKAFNIREGLTRADDALPARTATALANGSGREKPVDPRVLHECTSLFYGMMGWNPETGIPTRPKLEELDVAWVEDCM